MKERDLKKLIQDKLKKPISSVKIFEEGIDIETQIEFEKITKSLIEDKKTEQNITIAEKKLLSEDTPEDIKKEILTRLSISEDVKAYRLIEHYKNICEESLKKWATLSLQKARAHIEHTLSNDEKIYISSGLGGSDDKLRYFFVLSASDNINFTKFHRDILKKEIEFVMQSHGSIAESILIYDYFATIVCLVPIHVSLDIIFKTILDECNAFGNFLSEKIIATNAEKFDNQTIEKMLNDELQEINELDNFEEIDFHFNEDDDDFFGDDDDDDFFEDDDDDDFI